MGSFFSSSKEGYPLNVFRVSFFTFTTDLTQQQVLFSTLFVDGNPLPWLLLHNEFGRQYLGTRLVESGHNAGYQTKHSKKRFTVGSLIQ
jgi:hypothetical protein